MATIGDAITAALEELGVLQAGETPSAEDMALGLSRINDWIDGLANEGLTIYTVTRTTWTIVSGTTSYAVGTGSDVSVARPVSANVIQNIGYIDTSVSPSLERQLGPPLTEDAYAAIPIKGQTGVYPTFWYYNPTFPTGTLVPWPVPTSSDLQGVIYTPQALTEFALSSTSLSLPPGYRRLFRTNLAVELAAAFDVPVPETTAMAARESKAILKRTNVRMLDMWVDRGALVSRGGVRYSIEVGP